MSLAVFLRDGMPEHMLDNSGVNPSHTLVALEYCSWSTQNVCQGT